MINNKPEVRLVPEVLEVQVPLAVPKVLLVQQVRADHSLLVHLWDLVVPQDQIRLALHDFQVVLKVLVDRAVLVVLVFQVVLQIRVFWVIIKQVFVH